VERFAATRLAERGVAPDELLEADRALSEALSAESRHGLVAADIAFHAALVSQVGSERLTAMHRSILAEIEMTIGLLSAHGPAPRESVPSEHASIIEAIAAGQPAAAGRQLDAHLDAARRRLLARLDDVQVVPTGARAPRKGE
ncbi:MAG: FCD domain-containing protein, partial [Bifidobacteriaceae bacterium]|nr:FCD domain-containing protein [Bifidobacteriaceae bacterium]